MPSGLSTRYNGGHAQSRALDEQMRLSNSAIMGAATAAFAFIFGFACGNLFDVQEGFHLKDWQTFASMLVAIVLGTLGYIGVRNTQRINVMIKEQDRIAEMLPGLRQVNELLVVLRGPLNALPPQRRYQAHLLLDGAFRAQPGESLEDVVRRKLPLADDHLKWEVSRLIFALKTQATILRVGQDEVERNQTDVANIHTFAPSAREGLLEMTERVKQSYERENDDMGKVIRALDAFAESIKGRTSKAEARGKIIREVVDKFFEPGS
jgi:hypothetical protein